MPECVIPLSWEKFDSLSDWLMEQLSARNVPRSLRLRIKMALEELFSSLVILPESKAGRVRCTLPAPCTVKLEYRTAEQELSPDLDDLIALADQPDAYGLEFQITPGSCTILVGRKFQ